jgi:aspartate racemase
MGSRKMHTLGLLGGMSWESTVIYYKLINRQVRERLGKLHSSECITCSFDFEEIEQLQRAGQWERMRELLCNAAGDSSLEVQRPFLSAPTPYTG